MKQYQKEKAYHAIIYFLNHTSMCHKKKTYKLLWILDSWHFQEIGRAVTGYRYFAWKMGPVPTELHEAIDSNDAELLSFIQIDQSKPGETVYLTGKIPFNPAYFSKRELALMERIAIQFDLMSGKDVEDFTHRTGSPWHQVWEVEQRRHREIPFEYALSQLPDDEKDALSKIAEERKAFLNNYK